MNYGSHLHVAREVFPGIPPRLAAEYWLGAMLPDFIHMSGSRIKPRALGRRRSLTARGIKMHKRTDDVFHNLPGFISLRKEVQDDMTELTVHPRQAQAWAEVSIEMLMDGVLFQNPKLCTRYQEALSTVKNPSHCHYLAKLAFSGPELPEWLAAKAELGIPGYLEPSQVVKALHRRLQFRDKKATATKTGLSFGEDKIVPLATILEGKLDQIRASGPELIGLTIDRLSNPEIRVTTFEPVAPDTIRRRYPRQTLRPAKRRRK
ncbi:hypothetical protein A3F65_02700 [Candidatus Saccharibacteria bacterium RIFCSPHIGHO2_12_FULL_47_16b]|nr:MAG: hypothetical protein A3F65_02700 [Candidatus Saccharibacteria bacterium RIFCSPHIGHO2_12_FULL_47_16b]OGL38686.1 MAG: hypothetical protein A3J32_00720 [Candidatus Saccharibacteria bacterium RIFCSPLOWO2_02_FULL_46_7]